MPKLIDYPRTSYTGAWEVAEVTDDTGGKCSIETAAKKLNRKVSGSFKAVIGSAVKFGLLTSKRELLTTTTLFRRIKHAYDKQEELTFHREAFLNPPLFTQICRKFRNKELPVQMLDIMLIREFNVEEINAQSVAKAFIEGCRMVGILDERNIIADIDAMNELKPPKRELSNPHPTSNSFRNEVPPQLSTDRDTHSNTLFNTATVDSAQLKAPLQNLQSTILPTLLTDTNSYKESTTLKPEYDTPDAITTLFGLQNDSQIDNSQATSREDFNTQPKSSNQTIYTDNSINDKLPLQPTPTATYQIQITGPGVSTSLSISEEEDITLAIALLEKIRRQLKS